MITNNNNNNINEVSDGDIDDDQKMLQENSNSSLGGDSLQGSMASMTDGTMLTGEQPDHDYIKMFVGQVPKSMDEEQLKNMFEEYGRVHSLNVLRDKVTGISKGKHFIVFSSNYIVNIVTFFFVFFFL